MTIAEKDIYKFVFYPDELSEEKREFINTNMHKYISEIELLINIKENLSQDVPDGIVKRIYDKIDEQEIETQIILEPVTNQEDSPYLILAADSNSTEQTVSSETFQDSKNKVLAKVITNQECSKIYIFPRTKRIDSEVLISLYPSNESHTIKFSDLPFITKSKQKIDRIVLDFGKIS